MLYFPENDHNTEVKEKADTLFTFIVALFCTIIVVTNIVSSKLFYAPLYLDLALPAGYCVYPLSFLLTDIVSEIWGKKKSKSVIAIGLAVNIISLAFITFTVYLPPHPQWFNPFNTLSYHSVNDYQVAYESIFMMSGKAFVASIITYVISQSLDVNIFHYFKKVTKGKYLWLRNNASTMTAQFFDGIIFIMIYLYLGMGVPFMICCQTIVYSYFFRWAAALLDTPFFYLSIYLIKRWLGLEVHEGVYTVKKPLEKTAVMSESQQTLMSLEAVPKIKG